VGLIACAHTADFSMPRPLPFAPICDVLRGIYWQTVARREFSTLAKNFK